MAAVYIEFKESEPIKGKCEKRKYLDLDKALKFAKDTLLMASTKAVINTGVKNNSNEYGKSSLLYLFSQAIVGTTDAVQTCHVSHVTLERGSFSQPQ